MSVNLEQDWPVYILLIAVAWFIIYAIINGNKKDK